MTDIQPGDILFRAKAATYLTLGKYHAKTYYETWTVEKLTPSGAWLREVVRGVTTKRKTWRSLPNRTFTPTKVEALKDLERRAHLRL